MNEILEVDGLTRRFGDTVALDDVSLTVPRETVVGLIGRNGSGKTTLLRHLVGLYVPRVGVVRTLGALAEELGPDELARIGVVHQENRLLDWMTVRQHLDYVASFYERWHKTREERLLAELELDPKARVATLSPGNQQKLAVLLAVCHRPELVLLDEPVAAMDPIARERLLSFLVELVREDHSTIVVSSHVLRDVERIVDWVVCLERGRLVTNAALDELQERYAEWRVVSKNGALPERFDEGFVLAREGDGTQAHLVVRGAGEYLEPFRSKYHAEVDVRPLNLERMFPFLVEGAER